MILTITPFLPFELGESYQAQTAVENYNTYVRTGNYSYLQECFANLATIVTYFPEKKIVAANASNALARVTFDRYDDIYKKCFIACSAESAFVRADLRAPFWNHQFTSLMNKIGEEGMDLLKAREAGLVIADQEDLNNAGVVFTPNSDC